MLAGAQVAPRIRFSPGDLVPFGDVPTKWYMRLEVDDRPGVLAQIAGAFGNAGVSIKSVWQEGEGSEALLLIVTHSAREAAQREAVRHLRDVDALRNVASVIRVESEEV
jgi:homoserine dehydrogenase